MARDPLDYAANKIADQLLLQGGDIDLGGLPRQFPDLTDAQITEALERAYSIDQMRAAATDQAAAQAIDAELARRELAGYPASLIVDSLVTWTNAEGAIERRTARARFAPGEPGETAREQIEGILERWNRSDTLADGAPDLTTEDVSYQFWWIY